MGQWINIIGGNIGERLLYVHVLCSCGKQHQQQQAEQPHLQV